mgnify:CR=1 FL=1
MPRTSGSRNERDRSCTRGTRAGWSAPRASDSGSRPSRLAWFHSRSISSSVDSRGDELFAAFASFTNPTTAAHRPVRVPSRDDVTADIGGLMGGAIVTEAVFNIPGIGRAVFDAIGGQEGAVVVGIVTLMVFFFVFFNLIVDVLYAVLDPRIRYD